MKNYFTVKTFQPLGKTFSHISVTDKPNGFSFDFDTAVFFAFPDAVSYFSVDLFQLVHQAEQHAHSVFCNVCAVSSACGNELYIFLSGIFTINVFQSGTHAGDEFQLNSSIEKCPVNCEPAADNNTVVMINFLLNFFFAGNVIFFIYKPSLIELVD